MLPKTPDFWYEKQKTSLLTVMALKPLSILYDYIRRRQTASIQSRKAKIPVLCVGNVVTGGSGKTPTLIALHNLIQKEKLSDAPVFLTRGYGGCITGPELVQTEQNDVKSTGDEPQILLKHGKTIISANRFKGAELAQEHGADLILMDDGFQNATLHKDINFLVIDGRRGIGNGHMLPCGPLREPLPDALARTQAIIFIGKDERNTKSLLPQDIPVFDAQVKGTFTGNRNIAYYAFAGLGDPWKFKKTLQDENIRLAGFEGYADHHPYSAKEIEALILKATQKNARLLTTEKDYQRIPDGYKDQIDYYPITLVFNDEQSVTAFLKNALDKARQDCNGRTQCP